MTRDQIRKAIDDKAAACGLTPNHYGWDGAHLRILMVRGGGCADLPPEIGRDEKAGLRRSQRTRHRGPAANAQPRTREGLVLNA
jgi:hypothetical protein